MFSGVVCLEEVDGGGVEVKWLLQVTIMKKVDYEWK